MGFWGPAFHRLMKETVQDRNFKCCQFEKRSYIKGKTVRVKRLRISVSENTKQMRGTMI